MHGIELKFQIKPQLHRVLIRQTIFGRSIKLSFLFLLFCVMLLIKFLLEFLATLNSGGRIGGFFFVNSCCPYVGRLCSQCHDRGNPFLFTMIVINIFEK